MSLFRTVQDRIKTRLGVGAYARFTNHLYERAYRLRDLGEISTFNFGYAPLDPEIARSWPDEPHQIQLYAETVKAALELAPGIEPERIIEISCGRGGGLDYIVKAMTPGLAIGLDRAEAALRFGRARYPAQFLRADALRIPVGSASIDLAFNIDGVHDYPKPVFFPEIRRVLKPGARFVFTDTMPEPAAFAHLGMLGNCREADLEFEYFREITGNVAAASRLDGDRRRRMVARLPFYYRPIAREFARLPGSAGADLFNQRERCWFIAVLRRPS